MSISRRDLMSTGIALSLSALFPNESPAFSQAFSHSSKQPGALDGYGPTEQITEAFYSRAEQTQIVNLAQRTLAKLFEGKTVSDLQSDADHLGLPAAERVNITLRHAGRIRGSMSAPAANLGRQVIESVFRASVDRRYGGHLAKWEMPDALLEVWIQRTSSEIPHDARFEKHVLLLGIEGVEIDGYGKSAYYKPSVAITSKYKTDIALFEALSKKARLEKDAWREPDVSLRRTQWLCLRSVSNRHFFGQTLNVQDNLPIPLKTCVAESVDYLIRNQDANGITAYLYDPIADLFVSKKTNVVRSAGCLFALSQVLQSDHHIERIGGLGTCTMQMARGLLSQTVLTNDGRRIVDQENAEELTEQDVAELGEEGESARKLALEAEKSNEGLPEDESRAYELPVGATALLAAALSGGILRKQFAYEYRQLYDSIASAQKSDGRFLTHFGETEESERAANYYSGQALLVLALEAERGNTDALERCRRAFEPYVASFRTSPTTAFVGWHVNVWSRIALLTRDPSYANFVFDQTDWLAAMQIKSHRDLRWVGGFSQTGAAPQFSSIVFLEATVRAFLLAIRTEDAERGRKYANCILTGLKFCKQLRLEETPATLLANPIRCKGGVALSIIDKRVRCDVVQHFITLCLATEQVIGQLLKISAR